jgi:hypothetical protein
MRSNKNLIKLLDPAANLQGIQRTKELHISQQSAKSRLWEHVHVKQHGSLNRQLRKEVAEGEYCLLKETSRHVQF